MTNEQGQELHAINERLASLLKKMDKEGKARDVYLAVWAAQISVDRACNLTQGEQ